MREVKRLPSEDRRLNRPGAEPEFSRVLIQPRPCGGLLESVLLG